MCETGGSFGVVGEANGCLGLLPPPSELDESKLPCVRWERSETDLLTL